MKTKSFLDKFFSLIFTLCLCNLFLGCVNSIIDTDKERKEIDVMLDSWHRAAANADFDTYFNCFDEDAVFIGTDATENWNKKSFMTFAKPFFDKGKAWDFKSVERHIYFDKGCKIVWFDELLSTQMKLCRGSGVLEKKGNEWKIRQYVLSMTIPNELTDSVTTLKTLIEDSLTDELLKK